MFQKSSKQQPIYLQKKNLFHHSIRKRDRQTIINKLRKKAQLPNHLQEIITNLPKQIKQFIHQIVQSQLKQWEETIAQQIVNQMRHKLKEIFDCQTLQPNELISFFIFLLNKSSHQEEVYKEYYQYITEKSNLWIYTNKIHIFAVFNFMLKKGHSFVLEDAEKFHSSLNSNRFFESQLCFYDLIIRKHPNSHNLTFFLPDQTLRRLSQQIECHFYRDQQRIKMIQILIQVLYVSEEQEISKCLDLPKLFTRLQYLIGYNNNNKLLVDRSILLIYNINIDATSKTFVNHSCFDIIANQMKDKDNHIKIRSLLAELYINCILNYPQEEYYAFLNSNICKILEHYQYIVEEFNHVKEIHQFIIQLLTSILTHCHQQEENKQETPIMSAIKAQASLLNKLSLIEQCQCLLQEFKVLKI